MTTFVELCMKGQKKPEDIDDFIEEWHASPENGVSLREAIGVPIEIYSEFMMRSSALDKYIMRRISQEKKKQ